MPRIARESRRAQLSFATHALIQNAIRDGSATVMMDSVFFAKHSKGKEGSVVDITGDMHRTFSSLRLFDKGGPLRNQLRDIVSTFACYRPDVGYKQGMTHLAGMLCLFVEETFTCFKVFANLITSRQLHLLCVSLVHPREVYCIPRGHCSSPPPPPSP